MGFLMPAGIGLLGSLLPMLFKGFSSGNNQSGQQGQSQGNWWSGTPGRVQPFPTMAPEQEALIKQLLGGLGGQGGGMQSGMGSLQKLLSGDTAAFEAPLMRQFNEEIIPGIAERFTGAGAGAQGSSAFTQSLGQAGAGLSERLGAMRGGLQNQGMEQLTRLLGIGTQPTFNWQQIPGTQGAGAGIFGGLGQGAGTAGSTMLIDWFKNWLDNRQKQPNPTK